MRTLIASGLLTLACAEGALGQQPDAADALWRTAREAARAVRAAPQAPQRTPPAAVLAAYGVTGTWAPACDAPAALAAPRYTYRPDKDGGLTIDGDFGADGRNRATVRQAHVDATGRLHILAYSTFEEAGPTAQAQARAKTGDARPGLTTSGVWLKGPDGGLNLIEGTVTPDGGTPFAIAVGGFTVDRRTGAPTARAPTRYACAGPASPPPAAPAAAAPAAAGSATAAVPAAPALPPPSVPATITRLGTDGYLAEGLRVARASGVLAVPRIEIRGTALSQADVARLLDPATPDGLPERLAALQAREVAVPEVRLEGAGPAVLRGLRLGAVAGGRIGAITIDGGSGEMDGGGRMAFTRLEADGLDLTLMSALALPAPAGATPGLRSALDRFTLEGLSVAQAGQATVRVARVSGRGYRVRPTTPGWGASFGDAFAALDANADRDAVGRGARAAADVLGALDVDGLEVAGVEMSGPEADPMTARLASIGYAGGGGRGGEIRLDGLQIQRPEGAIRLAAFSVGDIALAGTRAGLAAVGAAGAGPVGAAVARRLVPQVGAVRLGRLEIDVAIPDDKPATATLDSAEIAASNYLDGIPGNLRLAVNGFALPLRAVEAQDPTKQLAALGVDTLAFTLRTEVAWDEASREVGLREASLSLRDLATVTLRGVLGDVSRDVFSPDSALATPAALAATARALDLDVEDRGLTDRGLKVFAAANGTSVDDARTEAAAHALVVIPAMLGGSPAGRSLGQAVGRFLAKPGRLRIRATAKGPAGLPVAEIAGAQDPTALLGRVDLTATAE